jgi:hypothetical protein
MTPENEFPPDYDDRITRVRMEAALGFRGCPGDLLAQLEVCARYFHYGHQEGISHGELIDFLGVSSPSVLDQAGYSKEDALRVMKGLSLLLEDEHGVLKAPVELPQSSTQAPASQLRFPFTK